MTATTDVARPPVSLTVIVISLVGGVTLERCLRAVARIPARRVIIGSPDAIDQAASLRADVEQRPSSDPVPIRRAIGLQESTTEWVAFIEDTCEPAETWADTFSQIAHLPTGVAWGGPVSISNSLEPRFMAQACMEYGGFTPENSTRMPASAVVSGARDALRLPGLNLLYRRSAIADALDVGGLVESRVNENIRARGESLSLHPGLAVTYFAQDARSAAVRSRYAHGRIYGGTLAQGLRAPSRAFGALKCLALPVVLTLRAWKAMSRAYPHRLAAVGWVTAFACAWSVGEFTGLVAGRGRSLLAWT